MKPVFIMLAASLMAGCEAPPRELTFIVINSQTNTPWPGVYARRYDEVQHAFSPPTLEQSEMLQTGAAGLVTFTNVGAHEYFDFGPDIVKKPFSALCRIRAADAHPAVNLFREEEQNPIAVRLKRRE